MSGRMSSTVAMASRPPDVITRDVMVMVEARFPDNFGALSPFGFAVTRADAEAAFDDFVAHRLARFGDNQDAMLSGEPFLYHAVIAQYLNCGLLDPRRVCASVDEACRAGRVPINAAEGIGPALRKYRKDAAFKCRYNEMREEIVWYFNEAETPERGPGVLSN